jgi:Fic family protein
MAKQQIESAIISLMQALDANSQREVPRSKIVAHLGESPATINRYLTKLVDNKKLMRTGKGPATRYQLAGTRSEAGQESSAALAMSLDWGANALKVKADLNQPIGARTPVSYQRQFVDDYTPNVSHLLPQALAESLYREGRMQGQLPASTYARKVLEQLLIDLSWTSSRLEGNRYTLLATQELFNLGKSADATDTDAVMLLNHKEAIEFLVDAVPQHGLTMMVVRNVHGVLMNNLLPDVEALGAIRQKIVNISDTVYLPAQNPHLLGEMLDQIVDKARHVKNPIEAAFFLWSNLAYLQPFDDGNKRVSRVCANIPLMLYNCAPLSFLDVEPNDYAQAMMGIYELLNVDMAVELFAWTYRRSIKKYSAVIDSIGTPDPFRARYRERIGEAVRRVVENEQAIDAIVTELDIPAADRQDFAAMLRNDLRHLDAFNCARYRLEMSKTEEWVNRGRPVR